MKILVELSGNGFISCSNNCTFKLNCANHRLASLHRMSEGFSPLLFEEQGQFYCATSDEKADGIDPYPQCNMGVGAVIMDENFDFKYPHYEEQNA